MTDLNTQNPEYLDIRHTERGIQHRKTKKVVQVMPFDKNVAHFGVSGFENTVMLFLCPQLSGNLHCIMAFQRVNWQKFGPWTLNLENLRHDFHHSGNEQAQGSVTVQSEERPSSRRLANLGRSQSMGSQKDANCKRLSNTAEYRQRSSPDSDLEEDVTG